MRAKAIYTRSAQVALASGYLYSFSGKCIKWKSDDGRWETLNERESKARVGTLYRNGAGTLYFMLRSH